MKEKDETMRSRMTALLGVCAVSMAMAGASIAPAQAAPATCEAVKVTSNLMKSLCLPGTPGNGHYAEARIQFSGYSAIRQSPKAPMGSWSVSGTYYGGYISSGPWPVVAP